MAETLKRKFNIGIGLEQDRGVPESPLYWLKPLSEDINDKIEVIASERAVGVIEDSEDQVISKKMSGGTIAGEVFDKSFGMLLYAAFGQVETNELPDEGVFAHTFSVLQSAKHPTLTIEAIRGDNEQKAYPNCVIESLKLSASANDYLKFEAVFKGKSGIASESTPAYIAENYFLGKDISVKLADARQGLLSANPIDVKNIELVISKNIEDDDKLGQIEPSDYLAKQFSIEGTIEMNFKDADLMNWALNGDKKSMRIEVKNPDITIGSHSNPMLGFDLAKIKFREPLIGGDNNEIAKVTVGFKAFYCSQESISIEGFLMNEAPFYFYEEPLPA